MSWKNVYKLRVPLGLSVHLVNKHKGKKVYFFSLGPSNSLRFLPSLSLPVCQNFYKNRTNVRSVVRHFINGLGILIPVSPH